MPRNNAFELIEQHLFDPDEKLSSADKAMAARLKDIYTYWLAHPDLSDARMAAYARAHYKVSRQQSYNDIGKVKTLLGNVPVAHKNWIQNKVNSLLDEAAAAARAGDHSKAKSLTKIAEAFIKNNRLEQDDGEKIPYDDIVIGDLVVSGNPELVGVKPIPGILDKARALEKKYNEDVDRDEAAVSVS